MPYSGYAYGYIRAFNHTPGYWRGPGSGKPRSNVTIRAKSNFKLSFIRVAFFKFSAAHSWKPDRRHLKSTLEAEPGVISMV
jgi:hypothetical protein